MKPKLTNKLRLEIIEGLCYLFDDTNQSLEVAEKIIEDIYMIAHPKARCQHKDWDISTLKLYKKLKKAGIL